MFALQDVGMCMAPVFAQVVRMRSPLQQNENSGIICLRVIQASDRLAPVVTPHLKTKCCHTFFAVSDRIAVPFKTMTWTLIPQGSLPASQISF